MHLQTWEKHFGGGSYDNDRPISVAFCAINKQTFLLNTFELLKFESQHVVMLFTPHNYMAPTVILVKRSCIEISIQQVRSEMFGVKIVTYYHAFNMHNNKKQCYNRNKLFSKMTTFKKTEIARRKSPSCFQCQHHGLPLAFLASKKTA